MKGIVFDCLRNLVSEKFGTDKWNQIMKMSDVNPDTNYTITDDVDDEVILRLFGNTCEALSLSFEQASEAFGEYWNGTYLPKLYPEFYENVNSTRELLVKLDDIHSVIREKMEGAKPPKHSYEWKNENTLIMGYDSSRDLIELFVGAIKGAAKHYNDEITVRNIDRKQVEIKFIS